MNDLTKRGSAPERAESFDLQNTKCAIVVDAELPLGLIANTAAVLSLTIGANVPLIGPDLADGSGSVHTGLTTTPVPILRADAATLRSLRDTACATGELLVVDVTDAAQTTTNYADYGDKLRSMTSDALTYLGVALVGPKKLVNRLTGNLPLLR